MRRYKAIKNIAGVAAVVLFTGSVSGCGMSASGGKVQVKPISEDVPVTQAVPVDDQPSVTEPATQLEIVSSKEETTKADHLADANGMEVIGTSAKGYSLAVKDGITYVDGIMIVNKTYELPESYGPGEVLPEVMTAFKKMQSDMAGQGLNIYISSGFRSYQTQNNIYNRYVKQDGKAEADRYSARPGHSEHQTGLCFDLNSIDNSFDNTPESLWLQKHAQEYGFIIRYPKGKEDVTGYMYESWHLRYLGVDLATKVYNSGLCLEEYYGISSAYKE